MSNKNTPYVVSSTDKQQLDIIQPSPDNSGKHISTENFLLQDVGPVATFVGGVQSKVEATVIVSDEIYPPSIDPARVIGWEFILSDEDMDSPLSGYVFGTRSKDTLDESGTPLERTALILHESENP